MLFKLTGSSGAGKTTLAFAAVDRLDGIVVHEFDEVGVPDPPIPPHWRNRMTELWVRRALEYQARGIDVLLSGNSPLGEVLAAPSAPLLDGIAVCLIDVADEARRDRLAARDSGRWDQDAIDAFCGWAAWHRGHARDPQFRPDVIIDGSWPEMAWHRWTAWTAEDPRWRTSLIDTTGQPLAKSIDHVERWVTEQREAYRSGRLALARGWTDETPLLAHHDA
ncbi:hypothetical protein SAMN05216489_00679 [Streptomyces sp. 3213]|uniref:hypothetical protein n=1 Tax=Streptomyces sp. 3213.3 TaxID=1855348 RepID=UPI000895673C|nr:hypothetical protein [Streptomyces sp. 3213.3]SEC41643.1 hypothetical protein SAMN05216489_00679 [Streptomyces sp. 3213] [Streptomyces sp. 3213.3]